jgi:hypothetical protein
MSLLAVALPDNRIDRGHFSFLKIGFIFSQSDYLVSRLDISIGILSDKGSRKIKEREVVCSLSKRRYKIKYNYVIVQMALPKKLLSLIFREYNFSDKSSFF